MNVLTWLIGLTTEGTSWCESLNSAALSWPAVRELLKARYPAVLQCFTSIEEVEESTLSDIRLARKAGGFAYEYWCNGGDIKDVDRLLQKFNAMLGNGYDSPDESDGELETRQRVMDKIYRNAHSLAHSLLSLDDDVWHMDLSQRQDLVQKWKEEIGPKMILDRTAEIHRRHQAAIARKNSVYRDMDTRCLASQDVIGMTTTACARLWPVLNQIGLKVVICEEAAEVMEAQFLCTLLPSVEHAISIGDPLQLRPQVNEPALSVETEIGASYRLDESLMERMMIPSVKGINAIPSSRLNIQRRMHPDIADILRATLYPYLQDHESTHLRSSVPVMVDRVWWLDHQMPEDTPDPRSSKATSFSNTFEVEMVAGLVEHLVKSNEYNYKDITILTPYNGQLAALTDRFCGTFSFWLSDQDRDALIDEGLLDLETAFMGGKSEVPMSSMLKLATIDNFQGEESRVVILSTVRSNSEGRVGFLRTPNRINVGCSRARNGFYVVGNADLMHSGVGMWRQIVDEFAAKGKIGPDFRTCCPRHPSQSYLVRFPEQWRQIPECEAICHTGLPCGHQCSMKCHAPALHERVGCQEPCPRLHDACGHPCMKRCGEECGECSFPLQTVTLPCGHAATQRCGSNGGTITCDVFLEPIHLPCGHQQNRRCGTEGKPLTCQEKCNTLMDCGHRCEGSCHTCDLNKGHLHCTSVCSKSLRCGHQCATSCHTAECPPCRLQCQKSCSHGRCERECFKVCDPCVRPCGWSCEHTAPCTLMCCLPCDQVPCSEPCKTVLNCGHLCPSLCGECCPTECVQCSTGNFPDKAMMFLRCGHSFELEYLDKRVGIENLYQLDDKGRIQKPRPRTTEDLARVQVSCPICIADCSNVRRYALHAQLNHLEDNIDRMYAKFSRKLNMWAEQIYNIRIKLDKSYEIFCKALRSGPMSGRANESLIENRGTSLLMLEGVIRDFNGKKTFMKS